MVCGLSGIYLIGGKNKYGFVFCMIGSSSWAVVGFLAGSFPLICGSSIFIVLYLRGLLNWQRKND
jgi:hypothetical protein